MRPDWFQPYTAEYADEEDDVEDANEYAWRQWDKYAHQYD